MTAPTFLTVEDVLLIHGYQIEHFGGDPAVLDRGLLESAVAQPQQSFAGEYLHPDLAAMASA
jgi:death on curing protein